MGDKNKGTPMKVYFIVEDLRNDLLAYLATRPYGEVANGVMRLEALHEVPREVQFRVVDGIAVPEPPRGEC